MRSIVVGHQEGVVIDGPDGLVLLSLVLLLQLTGAKPPAAQAVPADKTQGDDDARGGPVASPR